VSDRRDQPVLSTGERAAAESLLGAAWGEPTRIGTAEVVWDRAHVVRVGTRDGRTAILKRPRRDRREGEPGWAAFGLELASLEYLADMPVPVAPRLLGADVKAGVLVMEDLPAGPSLADSLLLGDRAAASTSLTAYAAALGSVHAWSMGRTAGFEQARHRYSPAAGSRSWWLARIERGRGQFLRASSALGLATTGVDAEITGLTGMLDGPRYRSFVHGDLCPDNVRLTGGRMRFFDFEWSGLGSAALDAAYLLAPFPSCWCFADMPADLADQAMEAYRGALAAGGAEAGQDFGAELTAAMAGWLVTRGAMVEGALKRDSQWGTTTMRPRLLAWTRRFAAAAAATGTFPRLRMLAEGLNDQLGSRWPDTVIPAYPALAEPGSTVAELPEGWESDS
jgi:Ser/Thr protein kinase RdoA (MazF antagonist)